MEDLKAILQSVSRYDARLVTVSKTHPADRIMALYQQGIRDFGENKVQELLSKAPFLPKDIRWHFIGHLQTNKVKFIAPFISLIHTVDSPKLLREIEKEAQKAGRIIPFLFQFHIAKEESKYGIRSDEMKWILDMDYAKDYPHTMPSGIMGMATLTEDKELIKEEFRQLKAMFEKLKTTKFQDSEDFKEISMGMSADYQLALETGSTIVRIGSLLFGNR